MFAEGVVGMCGRVTRCGQRAAAGASAQRRTNGGEEEGWCGAETSGAAGGEEVTWHLCHASYLARCASHMRLEEEAEEEEAGGCSSPASLPASLLCLLCYSLLLLLCGRHRQRDSFILRLL